MSIITCDPHPWLIFLGSIDVIYVWGHQLCVLKVPLKPNENHKFLIQHFWARLGLKYPFKLQKFTASWRV